MSKPESKTAMRESFRIRHYIMNLIYQHPNERILIPGSNEIASMFGVGRATVTRVLKALTEEGYLEGRRGIGTFTLHQNFVPVNGKMPPLVGLLAGDGRYFYYPQQVWGVMANCGLELTRRGCNVRPLTLEGADDEARFAEISRQYLDGLVVLDTNPGRLELIQRLRQETGMKAVIQLSSRFDEELSDVDSFGVDLFHAGEEVGKLLLAENRSHLFFLFLNPLTTSLLAGIQRAYENAGKMLKVKTFTWSPPNVLEDFRAALQAEAPDAVYIHSEHFTTVRDILRDTPNRCRMIAESHAVRDGFQGILLDIPFETLGSEIGKHMYNLFQSAPGETVTRRIPVKVMKQ